MSHHDCRGLLERLGYSSALRSKYAAHGWNMSRAGSAADRLPTLPSPNNMEESLRWQHVVISLQTVLERPFIAGGRIALELQGFAHYLGAGELREVHLYGNGRRPDEATAEEAIGGEWPLTLSAAERVILEMLGEVPQKETFHQADMLMEGLRTLSPKRLQRLLVECRSVKVKRLFLWFAERHNPAWLKFNREATNLRSDKACCSVEENWTLSTL
jgi:hypothetical protein